MDGDVYGVGLGRADVAGTPEPLQIRPIFGLDMGGAGQPGRLRGPSGSKNHDRIVTGRPAQAYKAGLRGPVIDALIIFIIFHTYKNK